MPIDKYFSGNGEQVMSSMKAQYGDKKGQQIFYATANKKGQTPGGSTPKRSTASMQALKD